MKFNLIIKISYFSTEFEEQVMLNILSYVGCETCDNYKKYRNLNLGNMVVYFFFSSTVRCVKICIHILVVAVGVDLKITIIK